MLLLFILINLSLYLLLFSVSNSSCLLNFSIFSFYLLYAYFNSFSFCLYYCSFLIIYNNCLTLYFYLSYFYFSSAIRLTLCVYVINFLKHYVVNFHLMLFWQSTTHLFNIVICFIKLFTLNYFSFSLALICLHLVSDNNTAPISSCDN